MVLLLSTMTKNNSYTQTYYINSYRYSLLIDDIDITYCTIFQTNNIKLIYFFLKLKSLIILIYQIFYVKTIKQY